MGYYTDFDISSNSPEVITAIEEASGYGGWYNGTMNAKWYGCDEHCKEVSKMFPDQLIVVEGDGEEQGDQWKSYYKNGKMQSCKAIITFEAFDESKLK